MNNKNLITTAIIVIFIIGSIFLITSSEKRLSENATVQPVSETVSKEFSIADYNTPENCRTIINGETYDLTSWISQHPGGSQAIINLCGKDGTEAFTRMHENSENALNRLETFKITE